MEIALVAFTKGMGGTRLPAGSEGCVNILYTDYDSTYQEIDTAAITAVLNAVKNEKPDITIALLHWGSEFNDTVSESQEKIVELLQQNGVNAIIGTHSHYVQKMTYEEPSGNSYTPIFTVAEKNKPLRVVRIRQAMEAYEQGYVDRVSPETYAAMAYALGRIESRIAGNG